MNDVYRNLIVPDIHVALARVIAETLAPVGGKGMWVAGLSPDGQAPPTHWFSTGFINPDFAALLPLDGEGGYPELITQMCASAGLVVDFAEVQAMLESCDVTLETQEQSWARLGLQLVQDHG